MATEIEILKALKLLGDIYPSFQLSSTAVELYVQMLAEIPGLVLVQSALDHISRSSFFPSIAELRTSPFNLMEAADPLPSGYEAWADVQAEILRVGHLVPPEFKNQITARVVDLLGWRTLCLSENHMADRAHFLQAYQLLLEQERSATRRLHTVCDFIEQLNSQKYPELPNTPQAVV